MSKHRTNSALRVALGAFRDDLARWAETLGLPQRKGRHRDDTEEALVRDVTAEWEPFFPGPRRVR